MPDQLTDRARRAAEEILDYCDLSSHDCDRVADIIERHMHGWLEDIRKMAIEEKKKTRRTYILATSGPTFPSRRRG